MTQIKVDFEKKLGKIKPLNGFNNSARKTNYGEVLPDFMALNPPFVRLHDTGGKYGGTHYVDVPNIFPDFSLDADNEENYDFTLTDLYLKPLCEAGVKIIYRLGVTIEHEPKKYNIFAPSDPYKWADICEHIVRHYNDGWANGYRWNIEFWEIWNEPDGLDPKIEPYGPPNWQGSAEQYYELYSITANHIKNKHPEVKVGGYSSCYILGSNIDGKWTPGNYEYFENFLKYISAKETQAPLDFFSWHGYLSCRNIEKTGIECNFVDTMLAKYGFDDTLRFDTEWNCCICDKDTQDYRTEYYINMRTNKGASHVAATMYEMQNLKIDAAMFYDAQLWCEYGCLFNVPSLTPSKTYYAFKQFDEFRTLQNQCFSEKANNVYSLAAVGEYAMVGISNLNMHDEEIVLNINGCNGFSAQMYLLNEEHNLDLICEFDICEENRFVLPAYSFVSIKITEGKHNEV